MWSGHLHDSEFVSRMLEHVKENQDRYGTAMRMKGMLTLAKEVGEYMFFLCVVEPLLNLGCPLSFKELAVPFYFTASKLARSFHCCTPSLNDLGYVFLPLSLSFLPIVYLGLHSWMPVIPFLDPTHVQGRSKQRLLIVRSTTWSGAGSKWTLSRWKIWVRVRLHVSCWRKNLCKLPCVCVIVGAWPLNDGQGRKQILNDTLAWRSFLVILNLWDINKTQCLIGDLKRKRYLERAIKENVMMMMMMMRIHKKAQSTTTEAKKPSFLPLPLQRTPVTVGSREANR